MSRLAYSDLNEREDPLALSESEYEVRWMLLQRRLNRNRQDHTDPRTGVLSETPAFARDEADILYEHNVSIYRQMGLIMDDIVDDDDPIKEADEGSETDDSDSSSESAPDQPITDPA